MRGRKCGVHVCRKSFILSAGACLGLTARVLVCVVAVVDLCMYVDMCVCICVGYECL